MSFDVLEQPLTPDEILLEGTRFTRTNLLQQLDRLVASRHFRNSKRYPALLRFVVEQTVAGHADELKERTLGVHVFEREPDYDTNLDPIVRVTAGEIRKRIAQYYQEPEHESELRIDLPLGSYVPHFVAGVARPTTTSPETPLPAPADITPPPAPDILSSAADAPPSPLPPEPSPLAPPARPSRRRIILATAILGLVAVCALVLTQTLSPREPEGAIETIWHPILTSRASALVVMGVHTLDSNGHDIPPDVNASFAHDQPQETMLSSMIHSEMVPVSDIVSYSRITDLLIRHDHPYSTQASTETTVDALRHGPVLLLGGLDNVWTMRSTAKLRYRFFAKTVADSGIMDSQQPATAWTFDNSQRALGNSRDYAIVASYFDPEIEQRVVIAAGIGKTGTQAAAEFLTSNRYLKSWLAASHLPRDRNVELVLSTDILDGRPGPPHVLASYSW